MLIRKEKSDSQELSFAVESFVSEQSTFAAKNLVRTWEVWSCQGNIILRNLTAEERAQLTQLKSPNVESGLQSEIWDLTVLVFVKNLFNKPICQIESD